MNLRESWPKAFVIGKDRVVVAQFIVRTSLEEAIRAAVRESFLSRGPNSRERIADEMRNAHVATARPSDVTLVRSRLGL